MALSAFPFLTLFKMQGEKEVHLLLAIFNAFVGLAGIFFLDNLFMDGSVTSSAGVSAGGTVVQNIVFTSADTPSWDFISYFILFLILFNFLVSLYKVKRYLD